MLTAQLASCMSSAAVQRTLNGLLGGLEAQTHVLVPAQTTLAGDLVCCLLGPGVHEAAAGELGVQKAVGE